MLNRAQGRKKYKGAIKVYTNAQQLIDTGLPLSEILKQLKIIKIKSL